MNNKVALYALISVSILTGASASFVRATQEEEKTTDMHIVMKQFVVSELTRKFPTMFTSQNPDEQRLLTAGQHALAELLAVKIEYFAKNHQQPRAVNSSGG